ncbi:hypothetical protein DSO57_1002427 [Entomophthora muscae]|uniref:Uncharacterized protein n=1 Tax=Entomophthora muscae TaxID=34485 RepID=A0ACC2SAL2_9FUNG|nr:hypothetical protein DSO57_1002427 [Entomophthora muscae]
MSVQRSHTGHAQLSCTPVVSSVVLVLIGICLFELDVWLNLKMVQGAPDLYLPYIVTKVTCSKPRAGIKPAPSHQAGLAGGGDFPAPGLALKSKNSGAETIPALVAAAGPVLGPKSYA